VEQIIKKYLLSFEFGEYQSFKNMGIFPIFTSLDQSPEYMTLKEALDEKLLIISEVSQGGSVPELKVNNKAEIPVLLLDGEELAGAKQNRVLNTTILVKEKSEIVIPVSCTEQGRWSYVSREFYDAGIVMSPKLRMMKAHHVSASLESSREYRSDQAAVWDRIDGMAFLAQTESPTGAMKDLYEAKMHDLDEYLKAFAYVPHQKGLFVFISGELIGLDFISRERAFEKLHPKLVKSYAMEAILERKEEGRKPEKKETEDFRKEATECEEKKYESVGKGWDYRYTGKSVVGSALLVDHMVIHMAFFRITESEKEGRMAGYRRRRSFRY
jgi:hypothetical protein